MPCFQLRTVIQNDPDRPVVLNRNGTHAGPQSQLTSQRFKLANQVFEDHADAFQRAAEPFVKDALEQYHELREVHVPRCGTAVEHQRTQQHFLQQRVVDAFVERLAGRRLGTLEIQCVAGVDPLQQFAKVVDLLREPVGDLFEEELEVVVESQPTTGKDDRRLPLRAEMEVVPPQTQLPQQHAQ